MSYSDLPVAVGSCIATIATLLIVVRLSSSQRQYAFMRTLRGWVRLPTSRALLILASLVAMPFAVLFWSVTHEAAYGSVASVTPYTKVPAIDAFDDDKAAGGNADERALDALRGYVGQLPNSAAARAQSNAASGGAERSTGRQHHDREARTAIGRRYDRQERLEDARVVLPQHRAVRRRGQSIWDGASPRPVRP